MRGKYYPVSHRSKKEREESSEFFKNMVTVLFVAIIIVLYFIGLS